MHERRRGAAARSAIAANVQQLLGIPVGTGTPEVDGQVGHARFRVDPGRRPTFAIGVIASVVAALSLWWVLSEHPQTEALPPPALHTAASPATKSAAEQMVGRQATKSGVPDAVASGTPSSITVDVTGKVLHPGLYELPTGSRVQAAVTAAGGVLPGVDLSKTNLARRLVDGEQVAVAIAGAAPVDGGSSQPETGVGGSAGVGTRVNLNTATAAQLDTLPGVGPALAKRIIDWRTAHQRFDSVEKLREVSGIGPAKYDELKALVTV